MKDYFLCVCESDTGGKGTRKRIIIGYALYSYQIYFVHRSATESKPYTDFKEKHRLAKFLFSADSLTVDISGKMQSLFVEKAWALLKTEQDEKINSALFNMARINENMRCEK